jgi:hypothetical protein
MYKKKLDIVRKRKGSSLKGVMNSLISKRLVDVSFRSTKALEEHVPGWWWETRLDQNIADDQYSEKEKGCGAHGPSETNARDQARNHNGQDDAADGGPGHDDAESESAMTGEPCCGRSKCCQESAHHNPANWERWYILEKNKKLHPTALTTP